MRLLRSILSLGALPPNPRDLAPSRQNICVASQLGAPPPNPGRLFAEGRRTRRLPVIPAAESALGLRPRRALSSAQVIPEWTTSTQPCNNFSSDGDNPLNLLSHSRGALQLHGLATVCRPIARRKRGRTIRIAMPSSST